MWDFYWIFRVYLFFLFIKFPFDFSLFLLIFLLKFFCSFVSRMFVIVHWSLFMSQSKSLSDNFNIINILVVVSVDFLYSFMLGFPCSILTLIYNFVLNLLDIVLWHSGSYFCFSKSPLTLWEGEGRYRLIITRWRRKSNSLAILHCHPSVEGHFIAGWEWNFRSPCLCSHHSSSRERDASLPLGRGGSPELSCVLYW